MKGSFKKITTSRAIAAMAIIVLLAIITCMMVSNNKRSHHQKVLDWRKQKNNYFETDNNSPIDNKENFSGLTYFEPSNEYEVKAKLTLLNDTLPVTMLRTDGKKAKYLKYALAKFKLHKKELQLTVFKSFENSVVENVLFVPFTDQTTGKQTYKSGRYLDIESKDGEKEIILDFNYAYNPFCAYNPRFSCPIPPISNYLETEILAGEKYSGEEH